MVPSWLELLLVTQFYTICTKHLSSSRNECNLFCIDCEEEPTAFCYYCRSCNHSTHRVIQIRRSSYHNVVRASELEDIIDITSVQTYVINGAKVVFLNERPQLRGSGVSIGKAISTSPYKCETCCRALLDEFRFCSIGCNLSGIKKDMKSEVAGEEDVAGNENDGSSTESNKEGPSTDNVEEPPPKRRHRRKGIPQRAPFF